MAVELGNDLVALRHVQDHVRHHVVGGVAPATFREGLEREACAQAPCRAPRAAKPLVTSDCKIKDTLDVHLVVTQDNSMQFTGFNASLSSQETVSGFTPWPENSPCWQDTNILVVR